MTTAAQNARPQPRRWAPVIGFVIAGLALSGCTSAAPGATPAPQSTVAESTPTPTDAVLAAPTRVFGGDCGAALSNGDASAALGETVSYTAATATLHYEFAIEQVGGVNCTAGTIGAADGTAALLSVLLPAEYLPANAVLDPFCDGPETGTTGQGYCQFELVSEGFWLSGIVITATGTTNDDARDAISALSASFAANAAAATPYAATPAVAGSWPDREKTDCAALTASAPVAAVLEGSAITGQLEGFGGGVAGLFRASEVAELSTCVWSGTTSDGQPVDFSTSALPGGAWAAHVIAEREGAEELSWDGLERVISVPGSSEGTAYVAEQLHVFDGSNWLLISFSGDRAASIDTLGPFAVAFIAGLNEAR